MRKSGALEKRSTASASIASARRAASSGVSGGDSRVFTRPGAGRFVKIAEHLPALLRPGAMVAADRDVAFAGGTALALPDGFAAGTYFLYRMGAGPAP